MRSNGLIVFVPKYGIEGAVYLEPAAGAAGDKRGGGGGGGKQQQQQEQQGEFVYDEEKQARCAAHAAQVPARA